MILIFLYKMSANSIPKGKNELINPQPDDNPAKGKRPRLNEPVESDELDIGEWRSNYSGFWIEVARRHGFE